MPSTTTNYLLALYDSLPAGDQLENFLDYRTAIAGISSASNMSIIDFYMNENAVAITALEAKKNIIAVPASYVSPNTYLATVAGYTVYGTNDVIDVVLDTDSDATVQLNINSIGLKSLMKINSSGTPVNLDNKNLLADRHYLFSYDGTRWVWIGATSADQLDIGGTATNFVAIASDGSLEDSTVKASDLSTIALDNLASTAVNTDITSDTDSTDSLGTTLKKWLAVFSDVLTLGERASAPADVAGDGQFWVKSDVPNAGMFTDDSGSDYRLHLSETSISPTTANVTAVSNHKYLADISGLTASRNFVLPAAPDLVGDIIEIFITAGDADYELVVIGDAGVTINGGSTATEWSRLFITGERVVFLATTTSNWIVYEDGRIPCKAIISTDGTQTINTASVTALTFDTVDLDVGGIANISGNEIVYRRDGQYNVGTLVKLTNFTAAAVRATLTVTSGSIVFNDESPAEIASYPSHLTYFLSIVSAADTVSADYYQNSGSSQDTADVRQLSVVESF